MTALATRALEEELMDAPDLAPEIYAMVLRDLAKVNRLTGAYRPTLSFLGRALERKRSVRILDVGFGAGDILRTVRQWCARRQIAAELVGIDLNSNSAAIARADTPVAMAIDWRTGDYADLAGERFDIILSSLVAHHMKQAQLLGFLRFMMQEARLGWFINDLHRHRVAALGFPLLARLMRWHPIVRHDGALSIARAYRPEEWPPLLEAAGIDPVDVSVFRAFPYRLCVQRII